MAATKKSGANIPESQRKTVAVKLRLRPGTADEVKRLAKHWGCPASYVVEAMMYIAGRTLEGRRVDEAVEGFEDVLERLYERDEAAE